MKPLRTLVFACRKCQDIHNVSLSVRLAHKGYCTICRKFRDLRHGSMLVR